MNEEIRNLDGNRIVPVSDSASYTVEPGKDTIVLLTGVTGYVGGRLLARLLEQGDFIIRCLVRDVSALHIAAHSRLEICEGDLADRETLDSVFSGVTVAYFLVHAMGSRDNFEEIERVTASNFADASRLAGVKKIIYLGGLGSGSELSPHLKSRQRTGEILRESGINVIEFRASIIIGPGSLSFELVRSLTARLPIMILPAWTASKAQPIAISDVLEYLQEALAMRVTESSIIEIGGPDTVSYRDLLRLYAQLKHLKRLMISVPVLSPYLSSLWLGLVTPVYARIGRKLIESLKNDTTVENPLPAKRFTVNPIGTEQAFRLAFRDEEVTFANTRWCDSISSSGLKSSYGGDRHFSRLVDIRSQVVAVNTERAFVPVQRIGGNTGWYFCNFLWRLRAYIDLLLGGVGMRRKRRHPVELRVGDVVDFWRVEDIEAGSLLRLRAEMKLPGRAWLQFEVRALDSNSSVITQTAMFDPRGMTGLLYWYGIYPLHAIIFRGMIRELARVAEAQVDSTG